MRPPPEASTPARRHGPRRARLVIMVKQPRAGRVKTRLGRDIGMVSAAWWMRHRLDRLLHELRDPRWTIELAIAPDMARDAADWPRNVARRAQGPGDLGARMGRVFRTRPAGPLCIVGADIPGLRRAHVARAFALLDRHDAVLGPAPDGGYWLIGLKRTAAAPTTLFRQVRWSTPHALADTIASLPGQRIALADTLADVDTAADLAR